MECYHNTTLGTFLLIPLPRKIMVRARVIRAIRANPNPNSPNNPNPSPNHNFSLGDYQKSTQRSNKTYIIY